MALRIRLVSSSSPAGESALPRVLASAFSGSWPNESSMLQQKEHDPVMIQLMLARIAASMLFRNDYIQATLLANISGGLRSYLSFFVSVIWKIGATAHHFSTNSMPPALPLNVAPPTPSRPADGDNQKTPSQSKLNSSASAALRPSDISSPHELTAFVETLLEQLDAKFDDMSRQILDRMSQMSTRVDSLEASIQDIINADMSVPQSPSPVLGGTLKRNDTGS